MKRTIKSFVLRAGRISPRQTQGLELHLPHHQLPLEPWDLTQKICPSAPIIVEIGFGMGQSLIAMAQAHPEHQYIGIEVHRAGIGSLAADVHDHTIKNILIAPYDAVTVFEQCIPDHALDGVQIFFPDPWHKKRHHKRRLIQESFVRTIIQKLKPQGWLHIATDWAPYAQDVMELLSQIPELINTAGPNQFSPRPSTRPLTKFEQRGQNLGHEVFDLVFRRTSSS
jgi:tRNA (guanine-N7-)-methyltransferase